MVRRDLGDRDVFEASFGEADMVDVEALRALRNERQHALDELSDSLAARRISISVLERGSAKIPAEIAGLDERLAEPVERRIRIGLVSSETVEAAMAEMAGWSATCQ
jgi:predicted transcriptional regulator